MAPAVPQIAELQAPPHWRTVDFISDLHLQASEPATFAVWRHYMESTPADAVFILGDLFDVWVGDDVVSTDGSLLATPDPTSAAGSFEASCARVLGQTAARLALYFMHGNRDFLLGQPAPEGREASESLLNLCHTTRLDDPTLLVFEGQRWLLSHGDALCTDDVDYMRFRQQVRSPAWQQTFLAKPLPERQAIARNLRQQSRQQHEQRKKSGAAFIDVDPRAAREWLAAARASTLIHGHTHRPAVHQLGKGLQRVVLSDWDAAAPSPRAEVMRLSAAGLRRTALL